MRKPTVDFDWQELPPDQQFPFIPASARQGPASSCGRIWQRSAIVVSALSFLLLALYSAIWVRGEAEAGLAKIQQELVLAVDAEVWQDHSSELSAPTLSELDRIERGQEKVVHVEVQALRQELAAVLVNTEANPSWNTSTTTYRQLRFYRQTEQGWQPTAPVSGLWGQPQRLATAHFDFTYRSRDDQTVRAVAAEIDALYMQMRDNLGLSPLPEHKITIAVEVEPVSTSQAASRQPATHMTVPSPALLSAPDFLTDAAILRQAILLQLVDNTISEAISTNAVPPRWHPLLSSMRVWQIWELDGPAAAWREPTLRWFYRGLQSQAVLPAEYSELCARYSLWEGRQSQLPLPQLCAGMDNAIRQDRADWETLEFADFIRMPTYRFTLTPKTGALDDFTYMQSQFEWMLWVTLLDYGAATYGREQIGALWPILHEHNNWETLIPAVFGVSAQEFEAGWQAYIAEMNGD